MGRLALLVGGAAAVYLLRPYVEADERIIWGALLPAVYLLGMWTLTDGRT